MFPNHFRHVFLMLAVAGVLGTRAEAQSTIKETVIDKLNAILPFDSTRPMTVAELCHRLDCLAEEMRDDGLVVLKQPDVFSQARLTRFRFDVDQQMSTDLANFHLVLAARINRLDSATTTSTTALGAALAAPGTTNLPPTPPASTGLGLASSNSTLFPNGPSLFSTSTPIQTQGAFGNLTVGSNTFGPPSATASSSLALGVDPTVYLDEKKRFLEHLNEIRRINLGPDQNDSSGYGLYVVRLPVSITPGECTYQGYGADLAVTVEHEFTPDFLPQTFQNLVINDIVDQLGPVIYEAIRSGFFDNLLKKRHDARENLRITRIQNGLLIDQLLSGGDFPDRIVNTLLQPISQGKIPRPDVMVQAEASTKTIVSPTDNDPFNPIAQWILSYILRSGIPISSDLEKDRLKSDAIANRLEALADARGSIPDGNPAAGVAAFKAKIAAFRRGENLDYTTKQVALSFVRYLLYTFVKPYGIGNGDPNLLTTKMNFSNDRFAQTYPFFLIFLKRLYWTALPDDVTILDDLLGLTQEQRSLYTLPVANNNDNANTLLAASFDLYNKISLPSVRTPKQLYPIAPREVIDFFLEENIFLLAKDANDSSRPALIRANDVRNNLRHTLETAYTAMSSQVQNGVNTLAPLADDVFMHELMEAIRQRRFRPHVKGVDDAPSRLEQLNNYLVDKLGEGRDNIRGRPIAALCWAIAVDAAVLDWALHEDAAKVFGAKGLPCDQLRGVHFHYPKDVPNEPAKTAFEEYVRNRWPIITFALDPVNDQQNIADSFSLNRDLQLALSFAFATGQVNFNQLNTFRRQIQQSADTIALNRTVTGFIHNNDIFGFRFTPRFQNPPNQRTNIGVIASQLIGGGPGPDYQMRKSKLEPGLRELTAVLLMPTFLPTMRMEIAGNWFKLNDPEHLVFRTNRMMDRGRRVQELRNAATAICNAHQYREADNRVLQAKLAQLDAMLPMQSRVIQVPFDNSASGFDLFSDGATALVPELTGFTGVDVITAPATAAGGSATATYSVTTLATTNPPTTLNYNIAGGTTSIADVFVMGKYISLLDTKVIAGGRSASFEILSREVVHVQIPANVIPTTTEDEQTYIEIFLATPNGMSNSLLIPYVPAAATPPSTPTGYDLSNASVDVFYQWGNGLDGKPALVVSALNPKGSIGIKWDSDTGIGPKRIQVQFMATVNNQNIIISLPGDAVSKGDYTVDGQVFAVTLLSRLQSFTPYPSLPTTPITFAVSVQPFLPTDAEGLRVRTEPKTLKTKLAVNLQYNATGDPNLLPNVAPVPVPLPAAKPAAGAWNGRLMSPEAFDGPRLGAAASRSQDDALTRAAQQFQSPSAPSFSNLPQPPPLLNNPTLLSPSVSNEAEQIAKMLTGQPVPTTVSLPAPGAAPIPGAIPQPPPSATALVAGQMPTIVVNPSPVMLLPTGDTPKTKKKHNSRVGQMFNRLGNRVRQAVPQ